MDAPAAVATAVGTASPTAPAGGGQLAPATVVAAEHAARERKLHAQELEEDLRAKQVEVDRATEQVEQAEERKRQRTAAGDSANTAMEEALEKLRREEAEVVEQLEHSPHKRMLAAFVARQRELEDEERALMETLRRQEAALADLRGQLAHPLPAHLPKDEQRAHLYLTWKRALAEREELLRQARRRKHELMKDLKARHESQVVLLELERRAAVEALQATVKSEAERQARHQAELDAVEAAIKTAEESMQTFRKEFDQLRVAMLMDRMAKNVQVAGLLAKRQQLASQAQAFQSTIEAAKVEAAQTAKREWDAKLEAEHKAGAERLRAQAEEIEAKMAKVRETLAERYETGFAPLLAEAEARHLAEVNRVTKLQKQVEEKEAELHAAHQRARQLAAATADSTGDVDDDDDGTGDGATGAVVEASPEEIEEFEQLRNSVSTLWEQLDMPPEDVVAFLSECDSIAPFNRRAYNLYAQYHAELARSGAADAGDSEAPSAASAPPASSSPAASRHHHHRRGRKNKK